MKIAVVTWFPEGQVGYLDFRYRAEILARQEKAMVISNEKDAAEKLGVPNEQFHHIPADSGLIGFYRFCLAVRKLCRKSGVTHVVLLHSKLASMTLLFGNEKTFLYWNEHPTHLYPHDPKGFLKIFKAQKNRAMRCLSFAGAKRATVTMPIGEHHFDDLLENGCQKEKLKLIYMGVRDDFVQKKGMPNETNKASNILQILYIGTVHVDRGRDMMIEAVSKANQGEQKVHLTIVGADEEQKKACQSLAKKLGVADSLTVIGRVNGDEIKRYLHKADVGLCIWADKPYWRFNPPTKLFEYLVAGLPIIANDIRTHTAYIQHNKNGLICRYSAKSIAEQLNNMVNDRIILVKMKSFAAKESQIYKWLNIEPEFIKTVTR